LSSTTDASPDFKTKKVKKSTPIAVGKRFLGFIVHVVHVVHVVQEVHLPTI
jgi:hypothetical protein